MDSVAVHRRDVRARFVSGDKVVYDGKAELEERQEMRDVTRFGDTTQRLVPGLKSWSLVVTQGGDFAPVIVERKPLRVHLDDGRSGDCFVRRTGSSGTYLAGMGLLQ